MVTAADGALKFYTTENNEARYETVEQAIELDKRLLEKLHKREFEKQFERLEISQ